MEQDCKSCSTNPYSTNPYSTNHSSTFPCSTNPAQPNPTQLSPLNILSSIFMLPTHYKKSCCFFLYSPNNSYLCKNMCI